MRIILFYLMAGLGLAACSDPMRDVPRLSEVEVDVNAQQADAIPASQESSPEGGFLSSVDTAPVPATQEPPQRGLLGFLRGRAAAAKTEESGADVDVAALPRASDAPDPGMIVENAGRARAQTPQARGGGFLGGLFSGGGANPSGGSEPKPGAPDYNQVGPGVTLPFGQLARLCGTPERALGTAVARYPERGRGYTLFDSQPGNNGAHNWFVTGFDDGCARQFTAALAMFGGTSDYETLRYGPAGKTLPVSVTDGAYETLKSKVCNVRKGQPCGSRITRMERDTVFVTIYPSFGSSGQWKNLLLHDGAVLATDIKQN